MAALIVPRLMKDLIWVLN